MKNVPCQEKICFLVCGARKDALAGSVTEAIKSLEFLDITSIGIIYILSRQQTTKALIWLHISSKGQAEQRLCCSNLAETGFLMMWLIYKYLQKCGNDYFWKKKNTVLKLCTTMTNIFFPYGPRQANLVLITYASSEGSGEPAHPRSLARTSAARSYKQWVKRNLQTESQIHGLSEWLGMRSQNLSWRNARRHKFAWRGSYDS